MEFTFDFAKINKDVKRVLATPKKFFSTDVERSWKESFTYFVVLSVVNLALLIIFLLVFQPLLAKSFPSVYGEAVIDNSLSTLIILSVYSFVFGILFSFFLGYAFMAWARIFKIDANFDSAFKIITYARTPNYFFNWAPFLNFFALIYTLYLTKVAVQNAYKLNNRKSITFVLTGFVLNILISSLFATLFLSI